MNKLFYIAISLSCFALASSSCVWDQALCDKVPKQQDIDDAVNEYTKVIGGSETLDDVLRVDIQCMRDACDGENVDTDLERCRMHARYTMENQLQFVPHDYREQLKRICECGYLDMHSCTNDVDGYSVFDDDLESLYNCDINQNWCLNSPSFLHYYGVCNAMVSQIAEEEINELLAKTKEVMEVYRIRKFCGGVVKSMVESEGIVDMNVGCAEEVRIRKGLIKACTTECFFTMKHHNYLDATEDPMWNYDYYTWEGECAGGNTVRDISGKSAAIQMSEVCWEYLETGEIPLQLRFPLYPASIVSDDELKEGLDHACAKHTLEEFKNIDHYDLEAKLGTDELTDLGTFGLATEYGFIASMRRDVVKKYTGQCWDKKSLVHSHCNTSDPNLMAPQPYPYGCDETMRKMDICDEVSLENFHWFLKYMDNLPNNEAVLSACEAGAEFGRHVLALPGLSTGFAAEKYAQTLPAGTQMVGMLVFHDCAVDAAMKANNYFEEGPTCNPYAMDVSLSGISSCE